MPVRGWVEIDELFCKGCELCVGVCPKNVMCMDMDRLTSKGYHPAKLYTDGCTGCAICAIICPDAAISVFRETAQKRRTVRAMAAT